MLFEPRNPAEPSSDITRFKAVFPRFDAVTTAFGHKIETHHVWVGWPKQNNLSPPSKECDGDTDIHYWRCRLRLADIRFTLVDIAGNILPDAFADRPPLKVDESSLQHLIFIDQLAEDPKPDPDYTELGAKVTSTFTASAGSLSAFGWETDPTKTWYFRPRPRGIPPSDHPANAVALSLKLAAARGTLFLGSRHSTFQVKYEPTDLIEIVFEGGPEKPQKVGKGNDDYDFLLHYLTLLNSGGNLPVPVPNYDTEGPVLHMGGSNCFPHARYY